MTSKPPSSAEDSALPPRHRPTLSSFTQGTTEHDLWAFDDTADAPDAPEEAPAGAPPSRLFSSDIPAPRESQADKTRATGNDSAARPPAGEGSLQININKPQLRNRPSGPFAGRLQAAGELDDIDQWDQVPDDSTSEGRPAAGVVEPGAAANAPEPVAAAPASTPDPVALTAVPDEFSPPVVGDTAKALSLRPHLGLSAVERIGLSCLLVLLLAGAAAILVFSLNRLPTENQRAKANDFPITGEHFTVVAATSYWRAPIMDGSAQDTVRRGTQLLPVLELAVSGGPAAIRVLFRNEDRAVVGDAVTRTVRSGPPQQIPATAGFDDLGMHAAYRTGESKPWTVEVLEAPSAEAAGSAYKKLFEMNIATDRR